MDIVNTFASLKEWNGLSLCVNIRGYNWLDIEKITQNQKLYNTILYRSMFIHSFFVIYVLFLIQKIGKFHIL